MLWTSCISKMKCAMTSHAALMTSQHWARNVTTTCVLNHTPGLKRKTGVKTKMNEKKMRAIKEKQKERWMEKLKTLGIKVPPDPSLFPDPKLKEPDRVRALMPVSEEVLEERALLTKEWANHQMKMHVEDLKIIAEKTACRKQALKELQRESQYLYDEAMKFDKQIFPFTLNGPLETPRRRDTSLQILPIKLE